MPNTEDLLRQIDLLIYVWDTGIDALHRSHNLSFTRPSVDEILGVMEAALDDIQAHLRTYRILMSNFDCNKMVNYVAWHILQKHGDKYDTFPLFFGHLNFIDESIRGSTVFEIPYLVTIAENLRIFHANGEKLAPYTFLKGVDLTFTHCARPSGNAGPHGSPTGLS